MPLYKCCPKCGSKIPYQKRYCEKCIEKVREEKNST